jgi:dUTP pyrophosphatase
VKVILINLSQEDFCVNNGDRIAQMVIAKHEKAVWINTDNLSQSQRGEGGFGHTGKQ